jgi:protein TonB
MNDSSNTIYQNNHVKIKPKIIFADTLDNLSTFLRKNLRYPDRSFSLEITSTVKLFFIVEPSGRITNIRVLKDVAGIASSEAIRLIKLLKWMPGSDNNGKKVRVSYPFKIDFNL